MSESPARPPYPPPGPARTWPIPAMDKEPGDKPSAFTWAMGHLILQRMADRETMKAITADPRMPAYCTVFRWVKMIPEFGDAYRQVRDTLARVRLEERDERQTPRRTSGRRTTYTWERGWAVCEAIEAGASLSQVVRRPGMPSFKAIYRWLRYEPEFRAEFISACEVRALLMTETMLDIAREATPATVRIAARRIHHLEGRIGRLTPKLYRGGV
jgi:hypothetical protein